MKLYVSMFPTNPVTDIVIKPLKWPMKPQILATKTGFLQKLAARHPKPLKFVQCTSTEYFELKLRVDQSVCVMVGIGGAVVYFVVS